MNWQERYANKRCTPKQAVGGLEAGQRVFVGSACGEPRELVRALVDNSDATTDIEVLQVLAMGDTPYADPAYANRFRANAFFVGRSVREAVNQARADYTPVFFSQIPELLLSRRIPIDVALIMVSPPDAHGYCSLGISVDITRAATESARRVIAQVNRHMPRTHGDSFFHVDRFERIVEHDEPLLEWSTTPSDDVARRIATNIERLISDGDTLQLGIGRLPDAVLEHLEDKHDLGIHTEMVSDGVMRLAQRGVITGRYKTVNKGKLVSSFAAGSQPLFEWLESNPMVEMRPSDYTNSPRIIAMQDNFVAVNSALEADLTGQVVADSHGTKRYSGIGGHADFIRGAALAKNGRPIILLPSTYKDPDGNVRSRIVSAFAEGTSVMNNSGDAHYIATEYGVAYLHGKSMRERAMALISVAHPDFRSELLHQAKRRRLVYANQILPAQRHYPAELEAKHITPDGVEVLIRPIRPDDEARIKGMFYSFSEETKYLRYHGTLRAMPHDKLQVFCNVDYDSEMALVGTIGATGKEEILGVGRYLADPSRSSAEMAFVVRDDWQGKGLGSALFSRLIEIGTGRGIQQFDADVLSRNAGMLKIFHRSGLDVETSSADGVVRVTMSATPRRHEGGEVIAD